MCGCLVSRFKERFKGFVSQWVEFLIRAREKMVKK
jgi:hypothetical protein